MYRIVSSNSHYYPYIIQRRYFGFLWINQTPWKFDTVESAKGMIEILKMRF